MELVIKFVQCQFSDFMGATSIVGIRTVTLGLKSHVFGELYGNDIAYNITNWKNTSGQHSYCSTFVM
jgi:hypothetical protein